ncbi:hypothetical protein Bbelb_288940 [Branchiostoma belcheri]|nr:hypothetical protein Bbelb_288940 [Branchiostoma belcheri]
MTVENFERARLNTTKGSFEFFGSLSWAWPARPPQIGVRTTLNKEDIRSAGEHNIGKCLPGPAGRRNSLCDSLQIAYDYIPVTAATDSGGATARPRRSSGGERTAPACGVRDPPSAPVAGPRLARPPPPASGSRARGVPLRPFSLPDASTSSAGGEPGAPMPTRLAAGPGSPFGTSCRAHTVAPVVPYHAKPASRPRVARSRTESGPPGEKSWAGERKWGRLYPGGGASRVVGLRGMGSSLVSRRGLGETAPPRHPRRGVAVSDSMQAVLQTSDLSLSVGLRAGVPRSKASFGQRVFKRRAVAIDPRRTDGLSVCLTGGAAVFAAGPGSRSDPQPFRSFAALHRRHFVSETTVPRGKVSFRCENERKTTTLSGGSLGSCVDEERSQLRELRVGFTFNRVVHSLSRVSLRASGGPSKLRAYRFELRPPKVRRADPLHFFRAERRDRFDGGHVPAEGARGLRVSGVIAAGVRRPLSDRGQAIDRRACSQASARRGGGRAPVPFVRCFPPRRTVPSASQRPARRRRRVRHAGRPGSAASPAEPLAATIRGLRLHRAPPRRTGGGVSPPPSLSPWRIGEAPPRPARRPYGQRAGHVLGAEMGGPRERRQSLGPTTCLDRCLQSSKDLQYGPGLPRSNVLRPTVHVKRTAMLPSLESVWSSVTPGTRCPGRLRCVPGERLPPTRRPESPGTLRCYPPGARSSVTPGTRCPGRLRCVPGERLPPTRRPESPGTLRCYPPGARSSVTPGTRCPGRLRCVPGERLPPTRRPESPGTLRCYPPGARSSVTPGTRCPGRLRCVPGERLPPTRAQA